MGPMQDPNGINAQILPIWVPYVHVCWEGPSFLVSKLGLVNNKAIILQANLPN